MDWTVYWFMFPGCILIAGIATFSGISGAALLTPNFLIGFPLFGIPTLTTVEAIGTSLFLEVSGFGTGVYRYLRMRLADLRTAGLLIPSLIAFPCEVCCGGRVTRSPFTGSTPPPVGPRPDRLAGG